MVKQSLGRGANFFAMMPHSESHALQVLIEDYQTKYLEGNAFETAQAGTRLSSQYLREQAYQACADLCDELLRMPGHQAQGDCYFLKGVALDKLGQAEWAIGAYQQARQFFAHTPRQNAKLMNASHNLALLFLRQQNVPQYVALELEAYQLALLIGNKRQGFLLGYSLGAFFGQSGHAEEAKKILRATYRLGLAESYAEVGKLEMFMRENELF